MESGFGVEGCNMGALIMTYTILGGPYDNSSIMGTKTLFYSY